MDIRLYFSVKRPRCDDNNACAITTKHPRLLLPNTECARRINIRSYFSTKHPRTECARRINIRSYFSVKRPRCDDNHASAITTKHPRTECAQRTDAVVYCWEFTPPFDHCLRGVCYFGQTIRGLDVRTKRHKSDSMRDPKDTGLHCLWRLFPYDDHWVISTVQEKRFDTREAAQEWMDWLEKKFIAENGGVMKAMDRRCKQTLNLQTGGQGDPRKVWEAIRARSRVKLMKVWKALRQFLEKERHLRVPFAHVETVDDRKVNLGKIVHNIRNRKDFLHFDDFKQWLEDNDFVWDERRARLDLDIWPAFRQFLERERHLRVPRTHIETVDDRQVNLGETVHQIRGRKDFLQFDDFKQWLEDNDFVWDERRARLDLDIWPAFRQFLERERHLRVPRTHIETVDDRQVKLGKTVNQIRGRKCFLWFDDFKQWLYDKGFEMHARNRAVNDRRWAEANL